MGSETPFHSIPAICPGSESLGVEHVNIAESGRKYVYYECPSCGIYLAYSPLKKHTRIEHGDR